MKIARTAVALALVLGTAACTGGVMTAIHKFEDQAAPIIALGCATFHAAEANPLVRLALGAGTIAANAATGGIAGLAVTELQQGGDVFCSVGPPVGDATTDADRAKYIADVSAKLIIAAQQAAAVLGK